MEIQSDINLMGIWSDDAAQQMKIVIDTAVLLGILGQCNATEPWPHRWQISGNINLGVTGTPLPVVANQAVPPVAGQVTILQRDPAAGSGAGRAEHPRAGPLDRDARRGPPR